MREGAAPGQAVASVAESRGHPQQAHQPLSATSPRTYGAAAEPDSGGRRGRAASEGAVSASRPGTAGYPRGAASPRQQQHQQAQMGALGGLARRPGSPGPSPRAASPAPPPGGGTLFEVRGASLLGADLPQPSTPKPEVHDGYGSSGKGGALPPAAAQQAGTYNVQARAGYAAMHHRGGTSSGSGGSGSESPVYSGGSPARQPQAPRVSAADAAASAVAAHYAAVTARRSLPLSQQQQELAAAAARPRTAAAKYAAGASASSSLRSSGSGADAAPAPYTTYHLPLTQGSGSGSAAAAAGALSPLCMHNNPLYASLADSQAALAAAAAGGAGPGQHAQRAQEPIAMVGLTIATRAPPSPKAAVGSPSSGAGSASGTPMAQLQAASNLTLVNDSRPISPGPFLSAYVSSAAGDSGSRPVSPHLYDQPATPGSHAAPRSEAGASAGGSPFHPPLPAVRTASGGIAGAQQPWGGAAPGSPSAAAAAAAAAGCRQPIYNRDGKFVGWKQNSNYLKPLAPAASVPSSSAPSSPSKAASEPSSSAGAAGEAPPADAQQQPKPPLSPRAVGADFEAFAAEAFKGFPDAENQVPGYVLGPVLGKGGFCSVRKALHELTGRSVACKIIEKARLKDPKDRDRVDRECRVMKNLGNHCAIVKMYEWVETPGFLYIMMEHCTRGSLLDYVRDKKKLPEEEAALVLQQLLHALQFCHRKDVVHRDIKLENILIDGEGNMKLIDFGLCGYYVAGKRLRCHCGSPSYAAPEIVARKDYLGPPVDVWSLGIVLFAMLAGYLPFHAKEKKQLSEKILLGVYKNAAWFSPEAADLLARMLTLDPEARITLEAVWAHPFVAGCKRWQPPGVGSQGMYRMLTDRETGSVVADEAVLGELAGAGVDAAAVRRSLRMRECNALTAAYHLLHEVQAERLKHAAKQQQQGAPEQPAGFEWDFPASWSPAKATAARTGSPSRFALQQAAQQQQQAQQEGHAASPHPTSLPVPSFAAQRPGTARAGGGAPPEQLEPFFIKAAHGATGPPSPPGRAVPLVATATGVGAPGQGPSPAKAALGQLFAEAKGYAPGAPYSFW